MQLSVPCFKSDVEIYDKCEIIKPKVGIIGNTYETLQEKGEYSAILEFISGGISSFISINGDIIEDKNRIRAICRRMPYITAETVAIQILLKVNPDDYIEGVYSCPRCHKKIITEINEIEDSRDRVSELDIVNMGEDESGVDIDIYINNIHVDFSRPVKIIHAKTGNVLQEIISLDMRYPTIDDCILGMQKFPNNRDIKRQFAIYANALKKINGDDIDVKWRKTWGEFLFFEMDNDDIKVIGEEMQRYGIKKTVKRTCRECGKTWDSVIDTSNFFVSGLQSV